MYQLKIGTIPLPKLYVCENKTEAMKARALGIPYLIKPSGWSDDKVVKAVLWRTLKKMFPYIKWEEMLGINVKTINRIGVKVPVEPVPRYNDGVDTCGSSSPDMEVSTDYRPSGGGLDESDTFDEYMAQPEYERMGIDDYIGDLGFYVSIEELQALKLLPKFMDDIANAIKMNLCNSMYMDGYNKKLDAPMGCWQGTDEAPNLIILDTSGSIPSGIAGTMVSLIDTLRSQANADLIITSGRSEYWAARTELPSPDDLAYLIGGANECTQFYAILRKHIFGKHWGNVIVFGDWDAPEERRFDKFKDCWLKNSDIQSTRIDRIMAFHTHAKEVPGYGLWATKAAPKAEVVYNTDWVRCMNRGW